MGENLDRPSPTRVFNLFGQSFFSFVITEGDASKVPPLVLVFEMDVADGRSGVVDHCVEDDVEEKRFLFLVDTVVD